MKYSDKSCSRSSPSSIPSLTPASATVLSLMSDKSDKASGTAFGLNGLALFTGSL